MTFWQFNAMVAGYARANGGEVDDGISEQDFGEMSALLDSYRQ
jgi:hypothetical protein